MVGESVCFKIVLPIVELLFMSTQMQMAGQGVKNNLDIELC
jgi:hypothetical protein